LIFAELTPLGRYGEIRAVNDLKLPIFEALRAVSTVAKKSA